MSNDGKEDQDEREDESEEGGVAVAVRTEVGEVLVSLKEEDIQSVVKPLTGKLAELPKVKEQLVKCLDGGPGFREQMTRLTERGMKIEIRKQESDPKLITGAYYNRKDDMIVLAEETKPEKMIDNIAWESSNAHFRDEFERVDKSLLEPKVSMKSFGRAKAKVESDAALRYADLIYQMKKNGTISEKDGTLIEQAQNQLNEIEDKAPGYLEANEETRKGMEEKILKGFLDTKHKKDATEGSESLTSAEMYTYQAIENLKPDGLIKRLRGMLDPPVTWNGGIEKWIRGKYPEIEEHRPKAFQEILNELRAIYTDPESLVAKPTLAGTASPNQMIAELEKLLDAGHMSLDQDLKDHVLGYKGPGEYDQPLEPSQVEEIMKLVRERLKKGAGAGANIGPDEDLSKEMQVVAEQGVTPAVALRKLKSLGDLHAQLTTIYDPGMQALFGLKLSSTDIAACNLGLMQKRPDEIVKLVAKWPKSDATALILETAQKEVVKLGLDKKQEVSGDEYNPAFKEVLREFKKKLTTGSMIQPSLEKVLAAGFQPLSDAVTKAESATNGEELTIAFGELEKIVGEKQQALSKDKAAQKKLGNLFEAVKEEFKV